MTRPSLPVIKSVTRNDGITWDILAAEQTYVIVYKNRPISIRVDQPMNARSGFKYKKMSYTSLAAAENQRDKLNKIYDCDDFSVLWI
jgi:hypothetical protein